MSDLHRPKKTSRFLIWGGWYGSRNIGDTAILLGIKELIAKVNLGKHYYVGALTTDLDYTNTNGVTGEWALVKSDIFRIAPWFRILRIFRKADRVIISGGTPIFDFAHMVRSLYFFLPLVLRKPFVLFGAGVKPIKSIYGKFYIPLVLNKADYISVRDAGSYSVLQRLKVDDVNLTADSAFFAKPSTRSNLFEVLAKYNIKKQDKVLVVAPRLMSSERKRLYLEEKIETELIEETPRKLALAIDEIAGKFDKVLLMAMHYYGPDSDVSLINKIMEQVKSENVVFIEEELRPEIAIALFKFAYVVLAMRLHAALLSASMYTPIVGIAYEQKVKDLFKRLELENYVVNLFDFSEDQIVNLVKRASKNNDSITKKLNLRVNYLRDLVIKAAEKALVI